MDRFPPVPPFRRNPAVCGHRRLLRIGIQESPAEPFRLHLVTCRDCGTTVATESLRREWRAAAERDDSKRAAG